MNKYLILLILFISCSPKTELTKEKTILMGLPQWHLSPDTQTKDIQKSKRLPQYNNQRFIYLILRDWINNKEIDVIIAEGCEGQINQNFKAEFNGWSFNDLLNISKLKSYEDILTNVVVKIEAKFGDNILSVCGDNADLIKKHSLIFSEIRGNMGFLVRLKEYKSDTKAYKTYHQGLEDIHKIKIPDPIDFLTKRINSLELKEKKLLELRNKSFIKVISQYKGKKIALVIGARHLKSLQLDLQKINISLQVVESLTKTLPSY